MQAVATSDPITSFRDRVRFSELDPQGVVFYSRYFEYADAAIIGYLRGKGFTAGDCCTGDFQVKTASAEFFRPLRTNDEYEASVRVNKLGRTSLRFRVSIGERHSGEQCCIVDVVQVFVNLESGRSTPVPESLRLELEAG